PSPSSCRWPARSATTRTVYKYRRRTGWGPATAQWLHKRGDMQNALHNPEQAPRAAAEAPIGRIVSVTGSQAIVLLEAGGDPNDQQAQAKRLEMGTLLKIDTPHGVVLGLVSALSVPMPISEPGQPELRILEVEFVGELQRK